MKNIIIIVSLFLSLTIQAQTAYVDTNYLITNIPDSKVAEEELKVYKEQLKKQITQQELQATDQFKVLQEQAKSTTITQEQRAQLAAKVQELEKGLQRAQKLAEIQLVSERNKLTEPIYTKINNAIAKVAKKKGYSIVVDASAVMFAEEKLNITQAVQKELGF